MNAPPAPRSLILIGSRGAGKTTVASLLGGLLGLPFVDADGAVEKRAGMAIRELFERRGEAAFRDLESEILAELCQQGPLILATGGGAVLRPGNRDLLRRSGHVVWLKAEPAELWARLCTDELTAQRRPNLAGGGLEEVEELLNQRRALYAATAHQEVETGGRDSRAIAAEIAAVWAQLP